VWSRPRAFGAFPPVASRRSVPALSKKYPITARETSTGFASDPVCCGRVALGLARSPKPLWHQRARERPGFKRLNGST
jgi:hypothetical protein